MPTSWTLQHAHVLASLDGGADVPSASTSATLPVIIALAIVVTCLYGQRTLACK